RQSTASWAAESSLRPASIGVRPRAFRVVGKGMPNPASHHRDLEESIDLLVASYAGPDDINNLGTAELPNKRRVLEALAHLKSALFIGFYSTRHVSPANLRYALSEHVYPAHDLLVEQIRRVLFYEQRIGRRRC